MARRSCRTDLPPADFTRLQRHLAAIQGSAEQVCRFWDAVNNLCDWLVELLWTVHQSQRRFPEPASLVVPEQTLRLEMRQPDWTDSVCLTGIADAVWQVPGKARIMRYRAETRPDPRGGRPGAGVSISPAALDVTQCRARPAGTVGRRLLYACPARAAFSGGRIGGGQTHW